MKNGNGMKKLVCILMSVGMVFSGNTFTGYSAQAETLDEITLMEDSVPVFVSGEVGEAISFEEAENASDDSLFGEEDALFIEEPGDGLPDADVMDDAFLWMKLYQIRQQTALKMRMALRILMIMSILNIPMNLKNLKALQNLMTLKKRI